MTTKSLIYKVARFNNESAANNLQDLITKALNKRKTALSRKMAGDTDNQFSLINYHGPFKGIRVGEFFDYTHGHKQPIAEFDNKAEALKISALAPPDKKSDFLHSILYFGIWKNSVILSQSMALRAPQFEAYINWLLAECNLITEENFITLSDLPPIKIAKKISNTKEIEFFAPIKLDPIEKEFKNNASQEVKTIGFRPSAIGWDVLKKILPSEMTLPKELDVKDVIMNSALEVTLRLSWSRVRHDDPTKFLDQIANQLRHVETEVDYAIHTRSGKITRDDLKLRRPISVSTNEEGLVRKHEMWERIHEWLEILLSEDRISPDA
ncbi:hypothetical protein HXX02_04845 [Microbulbifer elongatus]|uniref:Uncharacterized protein n=1 Tax=Microbulbifer elongatus TaxID=86173 RepID=A0ABT1NXZ7_9GAMM|nr:hypothetical protein [Microbulbifer elongatus]MCQ3828761.1 hypothetical protein [Microbulbifer elongatus]